MITKSFLFTGTAVFTIRNPKGGAFTYKLTRPSTFKGEFFASVVDGATSRYLGMVKESDLTLRSTAGSLVLPEEMSFRVLVFALKIVGGTLDLATLPPGYTVEPAAVPIPIPPREPDEPPGALFAGEGGTAKGLADALRACTGAVSVTVTDGPVKATSPSLVDLARRLENG